VRSALLPALLLAVLAAGCSGSAPEVDREEQARTAATAFLSRYVDPDGRVVRRDQGGDTVSEGQAYGLLLAEVAGDGDAAERIWRWSTEHLQRPDGLLSYLAGPDGEVRDEQAASDADLLAAWALARSGRTEPARRLAAAVVEHEVAQVGTRPLVAAGPWATGSPVTLNPSYWSPAPYEQLARATGDPRWAALAPAAVQAAADLTGDGVALPPDWARADDGVLRPTPAPDGTVPVPRYSLDAQRTVVWLATACSSEARALAATWDPLLSGKRAGAIALGQDGSILDEAVHPLPYVAAAAAADAAGEPERRDGLLDRAAETAERFPTYYGDAWLALGRALLQTDLLDACEEPT
jgi:endo-1,4-beta-D-glucanase Y